MSLQDDELQALYEEMEAAQKRWQKARWRFKQNLTKAGYDVDDVGKEISRLSDEINQRVKSRLAKGRSLASKAMRNNRERVRQKRRQIRSVESNIANLQTERANLVDLVASAKREASYIDRRNEFYAARHDYLMAQAERDKVDPFKSEKEFWLEKAELGDVSPDEVWCLTDRFWGEIHLFFGGTDHPDGEGHGHRVLSRGLMGRLEMSYRREPQ